VNYPILVAIIVLFLTLKSLGFNYKFNALSDDPKNNELMKAFSTIFKAGQKISVIPALRARYPALRFLVRIGIFTRSLYNLIFIGLQPAPNDDAMRKASAVMNRIGTGLLEQSKGVKSFERKDILSILAQVNSTEEKAHQMKDEDVMSRAYKPILDWCIYSFTHTLSEIPTFIIAGHETTRYTRSSFRHSAIEIHKF
jgi:hypothetical protein